MEITTAALRGLGRSSYRNGMCASQAVPFAERAIGHSLSGDMRVAVLAGWRAERSDLLEYESPEHVR